jgi:hypothetical protein
MLKHLIPCLFCFCSLASTSAYADCESDLRRSNIESVVALDELVPGDSVLLSLRFNNDQKRFRTALKTLRRQRANLVSEGFNSFIPNGQLFRAWIGISTKGRGFIHLRATKSELIRLRAIIESADEIRTERHMGENSAGINRAYRTAEEKVHPSYKEDWKEIVRTGRYAKIWVMSHNSRDRVDNLVTNLREDFFEIEDFYYNDAQSTGFFFISGTPSDLRSAVEFYRHIDSFQLPQ